MRFACSCSNVASVLALALAAASVGCAEGNAAESTGVEADEGALARGSMKGTLLVSKDPNEKLELRFGVAADKKTPIVTVSRDGKKRTLHCESFISLDEGGPTRENVSVSCTEDLRAGYDWCEVDVKRTSDSTFALDVSCDYSSGDALPDSLAKTWSVLSGETSAAGASVRRDGIDMLEREKAADAFADEIAFTEALVDPLRDVLAKKQTVVAFRTGAVEEHDVTRIAAHPKFATRATQLVVFASAYSAHADEVSVEGEPGKLATKGEIVTRILGAARCTEGPRDNPTCVH